MFFFSFLFFSGSRSCLLTYACLVVSFFFFFVVICGTMCVCVCICVLCVCIVLCDTRTCWWCVCGHVICACFCGLFLSISQALEQLYLTRPVELCPAAENVTGTCSARPADINVRVRVHVRVATDGRSTVTLVSSNEPECANISSSAAELACSQLLNTLRQHSPPPSALHHTPIVLDPSLYWPQVSPPPSPPPPPPSVIGGPPTAHSLPYAPGITRRPLIPGGCNPVGAHATCSPTDLAVGVRVVMDRDGTPRIVVGAFSNTSVENSGGSGFLR